MCDRPGAAAVRWEDLWSFNDERWRGAIFASRIPVVGAVGHETTTIADFVADRAYAISSGEIVNRNQPRLLRPDPVRTAASGYGDGLLPRQPQPSFRRFSPPATTASRSFVWPVSKKPPRNVYANGWDLRLRGRDRPLSAPTARKRSTPEPAKSATAHSPRAVAHPATGISSDGEYPLSRLSRQRERFGNGHASGAVSR